MKTFKTTKIGSRAIRPGNPVYIIFEVASTHQNNWKIAKDYVEQAADAGTDALKFQLFEADKLLNPIASGLKGTYDFFKTAETPREWFPKLKKLCDNAGIDLLCTPFDEDAASYLNIIGVPAIKIASGELTNHQLLSHVARFNKPVILSTGMATMDEVRTAVNVLRRNGCKQLVLLQCTSVYPMPYEDANVRAMQTLQKKFNAVVGYSDNGSEGFLVPLLAVALGASVIEKHVTSHKDRGNLDDKFSMTVAEFTEMVKRIRRLEKQFEGHLEDAVDGLKKEFGRDVETALGDGIKKPAEHGTHKTHPGVKGLFIQKESDERHWARRGFYPARLIQKGTKITSEMLISLRPDIGVSALSLGDVIGKVAAEDLPAKLPIKPENRRVRRFRKSDIKKTYRDKEGAQFAKILEESALFD